MNIDDFDVRSHSILLIGDSMTGKTKSVEALIGNDISETSLINSHISLYNANIPIPVSEEIHDFMQNFQPESEPLNSINCTIWDCSGKIRNFNYFIMISHISTVIIFCNLHNTNSCERIDYWKEIIDKYRPGILTIIVGTILRTKNLTQLENTEGQNESLKVLDSLRSSLKNQDSLSTATSRNESLENNDADQVDDSNSTNRTNRTKNKQITERNMVNVLQWCVEHGDIPFFKIDLDDSEEVSAMYNTVFIDRLRKIISFMLK